MAGDCKSCTCEEYAHEKMVDCNGVYSGDFNRGVAGFTPASWFCWQSVPAGCSNPGVCLCGCPYYQPLLCEPPCSDGCPGTSITGFPGDVYTRGPCIGPDCDCPLSTFTLQNNALAIKAPVYDGSGPPGMEGMAAMQVWWSGVGTEGIAWVGDCESFYNETPPDYDATSTASPPSPMGTPAYASTIDGPDANIIGTCNPPRAYRDPADYSTGGITIPTSTWPSITITKTDWNALRVQGEELWIRGSGASASCGIQNFRLNMTSTLTGIKTFTLWPSGRGEDIGWINLGPLEQWPAASSDVVITFTADGWDVQGSPPHNHFYLTRGTFSLEIRPVQDPAQAPGTGWSLYPGDVYVLSFWAKSVPDLWGDIKTGADGYRLHALAGSADGTPFGGFLGFNFTDPDYGGSGLYLTDDWRLFYGTMSWNPPSGNIIPNAELSFARVNVNNYYSDGPTCGSCCVVTRNRVIPRGSALIKCVHLFPLGDFLKRGVTLRHKLRPYNDDNDDAEATS